MVPCETGSTVLETKMTSKQKRKLQHIEIERRRRDKISDCLEELKSLVPKSSHGNRLYQLTILENAIDYIRELKEKVERVSNSVDKVSESSYTLSCSNPSDKSKCWQMDICHIVHNDHI